METSFDMEYYKWTKQDANGIPGSVVDFVAPFTIVKTKIKYFKHLLHVTPITADYE